MSVLHMFPDCLEVWILKKTNKDIAEGQGKKALEYIAQINTIKPVSINRQYVRSSSSNFLNLANWRHGFSKTLEI